MREYGRDHTDERLVEEARGAPAGDLRAFGELVRRHETAVKSNCRYMSGSPADAEDLAQDVFVKAYFGLRKFAGRAPLLHWLATLPLKQVNIEPVGLRVVYDRHQHPEDEANKEQPQDADEPTGHNPPPRPRPLSPDS